MAAGSSSSNRDELARLFSCGPALVTQGTEEHAVSTMHISTQHCVAFHGCLPPTTKSYHCYVPFRPNSVLSGV